MEVHTREGKGGHSGRKEGQSKKGVTRGEKLPCGEHEAQSGINP